MLISKITVSQDNFKRGKIRMDCCVVDLEKRKNANLDRIQISKYCRVNGAALYK